MSLGPVCCYLPVVWLGTTLVCRSPQRGTLQWAPPKPTGLPCCGAQQLYAGWKMLGKPDGIPAPASKGKGGGQEPARSV